MSQTHFAFVVDAPGHALNGADVIIAAPDETEAERLAAIRAAIYKAPLRRAVPRSTDVARRTA